eukprot:TRINITY_DN21442_c1_g2_i1.p1 TRINITY_DN21442_c1_g2~~TRINITY_DN21442_c1_g2_i1.p1  ORF type:complete len:952 (+),score=355.89 TRINITY_DN21442_c1_g2_i1:72-2858(+)
MAGTPFLPLPVKRTESADPGAGLSKYIKSLHGAATQQQYAEALKKLTERRMVATGSFDLPPSQSVVDEKIMPYFVNLSFAAAHFPMDNTIPLGKLTFGWEDCLSARGQRQRMPSAFADLSGMLFNAAAVHTRIAASQKTSTPEGAKEAHAHLCIAGGMLEYAEEHFTGRMTSTTPDISQTGLAFFKAVTLAQAHHCAYLKAQLATPEKHSILSRLAKDGYEMYQEAHDLSTRAGAQPSWTLFCSGYCRVMAASAHIHYAKEWAAKDEKTGEGVTRTDFARRMLGEAADILKRAGTTQAIPMVTALHDDAAAMHAKLKKENSVVYHEPEPPASELKPIEPIKRMGAPMPLKPLAELAQKFGVENPFATWLPVELKQQADEYKSRAKECIQDTAGASAAQTEGMRGRLNELGVMGMLSALDEGGQQQQRLPLSVRQRIGAIQQTCPAGTVGFVKNVLVILTDFKRSCQSNLDEVEQKLATESAKDKQMRDKYGQHWNRQPSDAHPESTRFHQALSEYKMKLTQASSGDSGIEQKLRANEEKLLQIDTPVADLEALVAKKAGGTPEGIRAELLQSLTGLQGLVKRFNELGEEEQALLAEMQQMPEGDKIAEKLLASQAGGPQAVESALEQSFKLYADKAEAVRAKSMEASSLLEEIEASAQACQAIKQCGQAAASERERTINELDGACNLFDELKSSTEQGRGFYSAMADVIDRLKNEVTSFVVCRDIEAEDKTREAEAALQQQAAMAEAQRLQQEEERRLMHEQRMMQQSAVQPGVIVGAGATVRRGEDLSSDTVRPQPLPQYTAVQIAETRGRRARIISPIAGWISVQAADGTTLVQVGQQAPAYPMPAQQQPPPPLQPQQQQQQQGGWGKWSRPQWGRPQQQRGGYGAAPSAYPGVQGANWACPKCTVINMAQAHQCATCMGPRPGMQ